ncbi:bifunctional tRNA (5-methylaminomethyl-2-thiouridine)(34)-methyltransferase MnmD/FAD-dependent 5-carboxymethylaminomethyl-2-thiouridine(34) oxidoreductase MnmC [Thalassotalea sp. LPB0316]|uniref:bifunctional tRNA (5-methylaminomethyl-2-thiouridine)(34)-methyltransferase MnmD/FAD-dependent 5-carboxymethylaminomethyl-2-thiouridine(34) oxidoreductase MnmC n=1 Tax=Thalassotalea sp. LPB0316 TaxID=2769490 RepID=UPI0018679360|nr:bifunctional tRNA (5-methylaminomethyl-2-thiouridine)(34)-methyltransferase MnmD/FAD-dependent 5-carboxymethylaminomethyl-2-thiouridine(34) oxidoreductase MnmC [Thalassotalea sp. LPB0316]QOL25284.1 bifunctional tRNA (5-methylaminomethyl-2-thiouridine)(34)-methyltransferase MnmD/FAD-dependent 5-carboxymethylaminomethyl-2-thiouridine(34) oxidoreductase MnmC [Thalassotalea sp. LPB0316]
MTDHKTTQAQSNDKVVFQQDGSPFSAQFDDIYFDTQHGYSQSDDVFIQGNNIEARLLANKSPLVIGETGFGTGLNFFITLKYVEQAITKHGDKTLPLTFISVEKYPLSAEQIQQSLQCWPEFKPFVDDFCQQYDNSNTDQSIREFRLLAGKVTLILICDDASKGFAKLSTNIKVSRKQNNYLVPAINAWYLDGFSPAKNPEMWSPELFGQIARLSDDNASLSTFTVAGFVKRGLIKVGFRLEKKTTVGRKNKSLRAKFQQSPNSGQGYLLRPHNTKPTRVAIIGSGIAAACLAYKLTRENIRVCIYCQDDELAQGGSSNAIGAVYPLLHQERDDISEFYHQAFITALAFYHQVAEQGVAFDHQWCGVLDLAFKPALAKRLIKFDQINAWPRDIIHTVNAQQASELANMPLEHGGLFMPQAGWVAPQQLVRALFGAALNTGYLKVKTQCDIEQLQPTDDNTWRLHYGNKTDAASTVVMCGGAQTSLLAPFDQLPVYPVRGQVSSMKTNDDIAKLSTVICHKGYLTPKNNDIHCIGATFDKDDRDIQSRTQDDDYNLAMYHQSLTTFPKWQKHDVVSSKARLRCMSPDHMPVAGPMPKTEEYYALYHHLEKDKNWRVDTPAPYYPNLYVLTGLGARGLCSAPLMADIIKADICGTPYPVNSKMLFNLAPNRYILKDIIKGKFKR